MAIKLVIGSQRGGVGKTTTSTTISLLLQDQKRRTLLIDLDPSADATKLILKNGMGALLQKGYIDGYEAMKQKDLRKGIVSVTPYLDLLPASSKLRDFPELLPNPSNAHFVRALVMEIERDYDFILFDVTPGTDPLNVNALVASDYVIPIMNTMELLTQDINYLHYIEKIQTHQKKSLQILGILASLLVKRGKTEKEILAAASKSVSELLFETVLTVDEEEAAKPLALLVAYEPLVQEILIRLKQRT